jgi:hypothetical protein
MEVNRRTVTTVFFCRTMNLTHEHGDTVGARKPQSAFVVTAAKPRTVTDP